MLRMKSEINGKTIIEFKGDAINIAQEMISCITEFAKGIDRQFEDKIDGVFSLYILSCAVGSCIIGDDVEKNKKHLENIANELYNKCMELKEAVEND